MAKAKTWNDIEDRRFDLENEIAEYLRRRGWKYTSDVPGCFWLWEREFEGRVVLANTDLAAAITKSIEQANEEE